MKTENKKEVRKQNENSRKPAENEVNYVSGIFIKICEIGIKGKNRYKFENALVEQIKHRLSKIEGEFEVTREQGRIFVEAKSEFDFDDAIEAMSRVFGVSSISPVEVIEDKEWNNLAQKVGDFVERQYPEQNFTFKVKQREVISIIQ